MDKIYKIAITTGILVFILMMALLAIQINAEENCQKYEKICYRTEVVFLGETDIQTRCSNNYDFQEIECVDNGYFWED
ncbi:hypothetical protein LCGC14_0862570 [marine sediment metagenome]|uniref:Transmembrane protein n=1 Tax=marine sediment metagenome TaxID=412755 RepID=A0A0F9P6V3_9ZZZZ